MHRRLVSKEQLSEPSHLFELIDHGCCQLRLVLSGVDRLQRRLAGGDNVVQRGFGQLSRSKGDRGNAKVRTSAHVSFAMRRAEAGERACQHRVLVRLIHVVSAKHKHRAESARRAARHAERHTA